MLITTDLSLDTVASKGGGGRRGQPCNSSTTQCQQMICLNFEWKLYMSKVKLRAAKKFIDLEKVNGARDEIRFRYQWREASPTFGHANANFSVFVRNQFLNK